MDNDVTPRSSHHADTELHSHDLDEAREVGGRLYYPHHVRQLDRSKPFGLRIEAVHLPRVTLGWLSYDTEVSVTTDALDSAYQVNVPTGGYIHTSSGAQRMVASPKRGAVYRADRTSAFHGFASPCRMLAVKIDKTFIEEELATMLGRGVKGPVDFDLSLDLASERGRQWWGLATSAAMTPGPGFASHPTVAASMARSLAAGLLLTAGHSYRSELDAPQEMRGASSCPAAVARARSFIEEHVQDPLTVDEIAAEAGVGVRALQHGFQLALGTSPLRYLRGVRLDRAREALLHADPQRTGVADIAFTWGFTHLGRFAEAYRAAFDETPSHTLRRDSGALALR